MESKIETLTKCAVYAHYFQEKQTVEEIAETLSLSVEVVALIVDMEVQKRDFDKRIVDYIGVNTRQAAFLSEMKHKYDSNENYYLGELDDLRQKLKKNAVSFGILAQKLIDVEIKLEEESQMGKPF